MADRPNFVLVPDPEPDTPAAPLLGHVRRLATSVGSWLSHRTAAIAGAEPAPPAAWSGRARLVFGFDAHRVTRAGLGDSARGHRRAGARAAGRTRCRPRRARGRPPAYVYRLHRRSEPAARPSRRHHLPSRPHPVAAA